MTFDLGPALSLWRNERGLTQEQLAHEAGVTIGAYNRIENGATDPRWSTVRRVADALGVSINLEGGSRAA